MTISPPPLLFSIHNMAASTSVLPPMRIVPPVVVVVTSAAFPVKYDFGVEEASTSLPDVSLKGLGSSAVFLQARFVSRAVPSTSILNKRKFLFIELY
ncbi:hypothetical protein D3C78_1196960 [compost metagenome]